MAKLTVLRPLTFVCREVHRGGGVSAPGRCSGSDHLAPVWHLSPGAPSPCPGPGCCYTGEHGFAVQVSVGLLCRSVGLMLYR